MIRVTTQIEFETSVCPSVSIRANDNLTKILDIFTKLSTCVTRLLPCPQKKIFYVQYLSEEGNLRFGISETVEAISIKLTPSKLF